MSQQEKNRLCLSMQTDNGCHITSKILFLSILAKEIFYSKYSFFVQKMNLSIELYVSSPVAEIYLRYLKVPLFNQIESNFKKDKILTVEGCTVVSLKYLH